MNKKKIIRRKLVLIIALVIPFAILVCGATYSYLTANDSKINSIGLINPIPGENDNYEELEDGHHIAFYETLVDALGNVTSGNVIKALSDRPSEAAATLASGKTATLDLNGKTITTTGTLTNTGNLLINGNGTIQTNATVLSDYRYVIQNNGTLTITNATITSTAANSAYERGINLGTATAKLTINNGTNITTNGISIVNDYSQRSTTNDPSVLIAGGTITSKLAQTLWMSSYATTGMIYITNGIINSESSQGIYNNSTGTIIVEGGEINSNNHGIRNTQNGTVKFKGGVINARLCGIYNIAAGTVEVTGGIIKSAENLGVNNAANGTITIGNPNDVVNTTTPEIIAYSYGVNRERGTFNFYDGIIRSKTDNAIGGGVTDVPEGYRVVYGTGTYDETTYQTATLDNHYNVRYLSGNLIYGLDDCGETYGLGSGGGTAQRMKYSINNGTVSVTALMNDGFGYTTGRVYLETGKTYRFTCDTNGTWGGTSGTDTVEAFLALNGDHSSSAQYRRMSSNDCTFTVGTTGTYHLRLDVNTSGKTYTFSNISVYEIVDTQSKTYGSTYGPMPTVTGTGYTLQGWSSVPNGYKQLEYIQSSGTQYIDTGYYWQNENIEIYFDGTVITNGSNQSLFGNEEYTASSGSDRYFSGIPHGSNGTYSIYIGSAKQSPDITTTLGTRFNLDIKTTQSKNLKVYKDGTLAIDTTYSGSVKAKQGAYLSSNTSTTVGNIFLFANHNSQRGSTNAALQNISAMRVYAFKLYDNGELVRNMIPCQRNSDNAFGMYDTVTKEFYTNAGTGSFTGGSEIQNVSTMTVVEDCDVYAKGYRQISYIRTNGNQYIKLDYIPGPNTEVTLDFQMMSPSSIPSGLTFAGCIIGQEDNWNSNQFMSHLYFRDNNNIEIFYLMGNTAPRSRDYSFDTSRYTFSMKSGSVTYRGTTSVIGSLSAQSSSNLLLLGYGGDNGIEPLSIYNMKIYGFQIKEGDTIKKNMIPVIDDASGIAGLYDTIGNKFYPSDGPSNFLSN